MRKNVTIGGHEFIFLGTWYRVDWWVAMENGTEWGESPDGGALDYDPARGSLRDVITGTHVEIAWDDEDLEQIKQMFQAKVAKRDQRRARGTPAA